MLTVEVNYKRGRGASAHRAGDLYTLKLIDNQQHTQHEFHQAKLKLSTEWIPDWQFKSTRMKLSHYILSRSTNVLLEDCKAGP